MSSSSKLISLLCLTLFTVVLINTAWLSDDSLITLRHVLNFINGYGPVFNIGERVQAFTHPIWFLAISIFSSFVNYIYVIFLLSFACSICTIYLLIREIVKQKQVIFFKLLLYIAIICSSKSFMDFSTSGLENPLTHLLLLTFFIQYFKFFSKKNFNNMYAISIITPLLYLNRMDCILIVLPAIFQILFYLFQHRFYKNIAKFSFIVGLPIVTWHLFSVIYYGFIFPNTAYAKLATGIEWYTYLNQGIHYLSYSILNDPITIFCIIISIFTVLKRKEHLIPVIGIILYIIYIIKIGGDFMGGRFFSAIFILSIYLIARTNFNFKNLIFKIINYSICLILIFFGYQNFSYGEQYGNDYPNPEKFYHGICDERAWYFQLLSFYKLLDSNDVYQKLISSYNNWNYDPKLSQLRLGTAIGMVSIIHGPENHIIDIWALADPLLSKLPIDDIKHFRIGHFERTMPYGYLRTLITDENSIADTHIRAYYDKLKNVVRGDLFSVERFSNILYLNFNIGPKEFDNTIMVNGNNFSYKIIDGSPWNSPQCINFNNSSSNVEFRYDTEFKLKSLTIATDSNDYYDIYVNNENLHSIAPNKDATGVITSTIVPNGGQIVSKSVRIKAHGGDNKYAVCYIHIE